MSGAIGRIAFGRFVSPDFRAHPGEYIPAVESRTGVPTPTGSETVYSNVHLPSGAPPAGGWPVAIVGTGANSHKNFMVGTATPFAPARGVAVVYMNQASHGFGPLSTLTIAFNNGAPSVTIPAGGRSIDQNGDGAIELAEVADRLLDSLSRPRRQGSRVPIPAEGVRGARPRTAARFAHGVAGSVVRPAFGRPQAARRAALIDEKSSRT